MGATLLAKHIGKLPYQSHSSTFGGGPLLCVAALATIQFIEERDLPGHAAETGSWFLDELRQIESPLIREVRGMGLMVGVELKKKVTPYLKALMDDGVLALSAGLTVLRFLPPLVITQAELKRVVKSLQTILQEEL